MELFWVLGPWLCLGFGVGWAARGITSTQMGAADTAFVGLFGCLVGVALTAAVARTLPGEPFSMPFLAAAVTGSVLVLLTLKLLRLKE